MTKILIVCGGAGAGLLGQRRALGIDAELQIDVSSEIEESLRDKPQRRADPNSLYLELDRAAQTAATGVRQLLYKWRKEAARTAAEPLSTFLSEHWMDTQALGDGLARSPAIGSLTITQREVKDELDNMLMQLLILQGNRAIGQNNPLHVWITSSTAGGCGEGIHRIVAEHLIRLFQQHYPGQPHLKINFIRVGSLTYQSIDIQRVSLNTFFGIATDATFSLRVTREAEFQEQGITIAWYYLDLPDVGKGAGPKKHRAKIVEMAAKAVMLNELSQPLNQLTNNDGMALIRTGYWGNDFQKREIRLESLRELDWKLGRLISPDETDLLANGTVPSFALQDLQPALERLTDAAYLRSKLDQQWWFPRYDDRINTDEVALEEAIRGWRNALNEVLGSLGRVGNFGAHYVTMSVVEGRQQEVRFVAPTHVAQETEEYDKQYITDIEHAHQTRAWCSELLRGKGRLLAELRRQAKEISDLQHGLLNRFRRGTADQARLLAPKCATFLETLEKVIYLLVEERKASTILTQVRQDLSTLHDRVRKELDHAEAGSLGQSRTRPIVTAELTDRLDHLHGHTWLYLLKQAATRNTERFSEEVINGAIGLTQSGLLSVLRLPETETVEAIHDKLKTEMGQSVYQANWWRGVAPRPVSQDYTFHILPKLEPRLEARLNAVNNQNEIHPVYPPLGAIGLNVLAFQGVSISRPGDTLRTPEYLMMPFMRQVREVLDAWQDDRNPRPGTASAKLAIASAATVGAKLYRGLLEAVGLEDKQIALLEEIFDLYDLTVGLPQTTAAGNGVAMHVP